MKCNLKTAAALAASAAVIGKVLDLGIDAVTWTLIHACGLDWGRAAARAPVVLGLILGSIGLLAIWVWIVVEEERSRARLRKAHRSHARNLQPEYMQLPEHTEREA